MAFAVGGGGGGGCCGPITRNDVEAAAGSKRRAGAWLVFRPAAAAVVPAYVAINVNVPPETGVTEQEADPVPSVTPSQLSVPSAK